MGRPSKRNQEIAKLVGERKNFAFQDAVEMLSECPKAKFDESVELSVKLGVDPRKADQNVRGTVSLPNGTGKNVRVLVFAQGEREKEALDAGADFVGNEELFERVRGGWTDFDVVVATPDMMREVGKLGKILGPRGLMPTPKGGTVTKDVARAVADLKGGKIEFKVDRNGVLNNAVGKRSFSSEHLVENIESYVEAISRAKPSGAKGQYVQSIVLSSTMGPGLSIDLRKVGVV